MYNYKSPLEMLREFAILILLVSNSILPYAQSPQKIYPFSTKQQDMGWYRQQAKSWKAVTEKEPGNASAWFNLYYAKRILLFHDGQDTRTEQSKQEETTALIQEMDTHIKGTYELNLVKWLAGGLDLKNLHYLTKANELGLNRTEHLDHMINVSELQGNQQDKIAYAKRKYNSGEVSAGMLYYNYNVLSGLDSNAILITIGDNDTYPAWVLQALGIRTDILVLNLSLLLADDYRQKIFNEIGAEKVLVDWNKYAETPSKLETEFRKMVVQSLAKNRKGRALYIPLTASTIIEPLPDLQQSFYLTGLTYKYSNTAFDNMAVLRKNFEQLYALDYLDKDLYQDESAALVKRINSNYIVPMIRLFDHYEHSGDLVRKQWIKNKLIVISSESEDEVDIKKHISR